MNKIVAILLLTLTFSCGQQQFSIPAEPIATWDFRSGDTSSFESNGIEHLKLKPGKGTYPCFIDDKIGEWKSLYFDGVSDWLYIDAEKAGKLDITTGKVTIVAIVKWSGQHNSFVAGMWDECDNKRQYGLFISLPYYNGENKVCGHISQKGGPTYPFPYSIDYSTSKSSVSTDRWHLVAITYDGEYIKSYLDGKFKEVGPALIDHTIGFEGYENGLVQSKNPYYFPDGIGHNGSDFTIGAVKLPGDKMGNFFKGQIRKISVFDRCLDIDEIIRYTAEEAIAAENE